MQHYFTMKRPAPNIAGPDTKKTRLDKVRFEPLEIDINVPELTRDQFMQAQECPDEPDLLRSLLREVRRYLQIRESDELRSLYSKLESISASKKPDYASVLAIAREAETYGIRIKPFVVKEKTEIDYKNYLADVSEDKMLIRRLIRTTSQNS